MRWMSISAPRRWNRTCRCCWHWSASGTASSWLGSLSIAPYHQDLNRFPAYLQQLDMESNGKRVTKGGKPVDTPTCPVVWGECGTNGAARLLPAAAPGHRRNADRLHRRAAPTHDLEGHHDALLANCFAQSEAFMKGKTADEVRAELKAQRPERHRDRRAGAAQDFPRQPSEQHDPDGPPDAGHAGRADRAVRTQDLCAGRAVGRGNSFDQWGVELGKVLAKKIEAELTGDIKPEAHDSSTNGLIVMAKAAKVQ
jgi:glucose-6-phosphate isomerase